MGQTGMDGRQGESCLPASTGHHLALLPLMVSIDAEDRLKDLRRQHCSTALPCSHNARGYASMAQVDEKGGLPGWEVESAWPGCWASMVPSLQLT